MEYDLGNPPSTTRDDQLVFRPDGTFEENEGAIKNSQAKPQGKETGTWKFNENETKIQITSTGGNAIGIVELFETKFQGIVVAFTPLTRDTYGHP